MNYLKIFIISIGLFLFGGCTDIAGRGQPDQNGPEIALRQDQSLGQTFVSRHDGLNGLDIYLAPGIPGPGVIRLALKTDPKTPVALSESRLPLPSVTKPGFYRFSISPQKSSRQTYYYALLEIKGQGQVKVKTAPGNSYLDGALHLNGNPIDSQLTFRPLYDPRRLLLGIALEVGGWIKWLSFGIILFLLPGWALLALFWPMSNPLIWPVKLALAAGLSLAIYPLLILWTDLIHIHLGPGYAWVPILFSLAILLWKNRRWRPRDLVGSMSDWRNSEAFWPDLTLLVITLFIFGTRFYVIRSLEVPLWGDSYHHTMIAQLLVDHGGLFRSWQPYADLTTFTYHFGFHSAVVAYHWITGLDLPQATLWTGQILNGLAILALYPLAIRLAGSRWAGVGCVLIAGLLSPMPMAYVNWGRYTQLAGQVILPAVVFFIWAIMEKRTLDWKLLILIWLSLGGLALTHYRILILALLFLFPLLIFSPWKGRTGFKVKTPLAIGSGAALLFLPWFVTIFSGKIMAVFARQWTTPSAQVSAWTQQYNAIGDMTLYLPAWLWLCLAISIAWGFWRREKGWALFSWWWFFVLLAANPHWLNLPGQGSISNFAVFIVVYIPAGIFLGSAIGWLLTDRQWFKGKKAPALFFLFFLLLGLWGARQRLGDLEISTHALVTRPDLRAFNWIRDNTSPHSRFLVNSFFAYNDTVIVGSDGGWWLPLLARRSTTLPPINYNSEQGPQKNFRKEVNSLLQGIQDKGLGDPEIIRELKERSVTHLYIGQKQGTVNYSGPLSFQAEQLLASPHFRPIYHQDRVRIFEVVY